MSDHTIVVIQVIKNFFYPGHLRTRRTLSSSLYSCHFFVISFASVKSIPFLSFLVPIFAWNVPLVSLIFLKWSLVFTILLFFSVSLNCSLKNAFLSLLAILWNSHSVRYIFLFLFCLLFLFFSQLFVRPPQTTTLSSYICFPWGWFWSPAPIQCYKPLSIVLQVLCLPDLIPWIYLSPPLYNHKRFDLGHTWMY